MCLAIPGKIIEIQENPDPTLRRAKVDFGGIRKEVSLAFTPEAETGNYVLVHVGFALNTVDEAEAEKIFEHLREMSALEELGEDSA